MAPNKQGKTVLHVEIDESDVERIREAFKAGKLAHLGVVSLEFPDRPDLNITSLDGAHVRRHRSAKNPDSPHR